MPKNSYSIENKIEAGLAKRTLAVFATVVASVGSVACTPEQMSMSAAHCERTQILTGTPVQQCLGELATAFSASQNHGAIVDPGVHEINLTKAPSDAGLARLRQCESTNRYTVTNKSGKYMGAYQFDQKTWNSITSSEPALAAYTNVRPHQAPPVVQDATARELYEDRGAQPWPECGKRI